MTSNQGSNMALQHRQSVLRWSVLAIAIPFCLQALLIALAYWGGELPLLGAVGNASVLISAAAGCWCVVRATSRYRLLAAILYTPVMVWLLVVFTLWVNGALLDSWL